MTVFINFFHRLFFVRGAGIDNILSHILEKGKMSYIDQREEWLRKHPNATLSEAWEAGYLTSTDNWCNCRR